MNWWKRQRDPAPQTAASARELREGLLYPAESVAHGCDEALRAYLDQLSEESLAIPHADGVLLPWEHAHQLMSDRSHAASVYLLNLPRLTTLVPALESHGTPSQADFRIVISKWQSVEGREPRSIERVGACLLIDGSREMLNEHQFRLVQEIESLSRRGSTWDAEARLLSAGRIRQLAFKCGARLDDYLQKTEIVASDRLQIEIDRNEALEAPVVEIRPAPIGAPSEWLDTFDRYDSARRRYDVVRSDGRVAHVVSTPEVVEVLQSIKQIPGRRVASDQARLFLHNPFAHLGDGAESAIDLEHFETARKMAGVLSRRLRIATLPSENQSAVEASLIETDGTGPEKLVTIDRFEAGRICEAHQRSRKRGLPLFSWRGYEIELGGETDAAIDFLQVWLSSSELARYTVNRAEVLDLSAYSDRVVGFDGALISVPYVARKDAGKGWLPENVEHGVVRSLSPTGPTEHLKLSAEQIRQLGTQVEKARETGVQRVRVPDTDLDVPLEEAAAWLTAFDSAPIRARKHAREPQLSKEPTATGPTPVLRILHNIEKLDYGASTLLQPAPGDLQPQIPQALRESVTLLPHQKRGLAWLQHRHSQRNTGVTGCLLADDMGLGKTLQSLCLIASYLEANASSSPCLVVAPVSLLENWKAEIDRFLDGRHSPVLALYGDDLQKHRLPANQIDHELRDLGMKKFLRPGFERDYRIVLTTYETLRDYEFSLARVAWGIVVCDEAQKIKTPNSLVTRAAKALRAEFKIACTGTPVENTLADLWCLFDFFQPGLLGSLNEFTRVFRRAVETRAEGHEILVDKLRAAVDPWILRRMKTEVTQLPERIDHTHPNADFDCMRLAMSPLQTRLYADAVAEFRRISRSEGQGTAILQVLHTLRMICSNPGAMAFENSDLVPIEEHLKHSPKLRWLLHRLSAVRSSGEKAIVFTEYRDIQRLIQRAVVHRFELRPQIVNGGTSVDPRADSSRQSLIDRFQAAPGFGVIILSTTAVGFGVNVQAANHVIHFTRPWNPAKEDQATDRAYRIGQTRNVFVYCPTVVGEEFETFDQRVDALLTEKRALSRDILAGVQEITLDDFEGL